MAPQKRRATSALKGGSPTKKAAGTARHSNRVAKALTEATHLSETSRQALADAVPHSLCTFVEDRHDVQVQIITMIEETLGKVEQGKVDALAAIEGKVANADTDKAAREAAKAAAEEALKAKEEEVGAKQTTHEQLVAVLDEKKKAVKAVDKEIREREKKAKVLGVEKEKFATAVSGPLAALTDGTWESAKDMKGLAKKLEPRCKEVNMDASLMASVASAWEKKPEARGEFDTLAITQLVTAINAKVAEVEKEIEASSAEAATLQEKHSAAAAEEAEADAACKAAADALHAAEEEKTALEHDLQTKNKAVSSFGKELKEISDEKTKATSDLEDFREHTLGAFATLKGRSKAPPPEPEPAAPEAAAPAAAVA